jgi:hypothetical protein
MIKFGSPDAGGNPGFINNQTTMQTIVIEVDMRGDFLTSDPKSNSHKLIAG